MKFAIWSEIENAIDCAKQVGIISEKIDSTVLNISIVLKNNEIYENLRKIKMKNDKIDLYKYKMIKASTTFGKELILRHLFRLMITLKHDLKLHNMLE
jgi:hypothetical protein